MIDEGLVTWLLGSMGGRLTNIIYYIQIDSILNGEPNSARIAIKVTQHED